MEYLESFFKAEDPEGYRKLAERGIMVGFPVSINGKTHRADNGIGYHSTVKFFDPDKDTTDQVHEVASKLQFTPPDPKNTKIEPGMFKDRNGNDVYVLKLHGEHADQIAEHNSKFSHMGFPATFKYTPHVSVDKDTWQQIVDSKAQTAHDAGIKFHSAELKQGHTTIKQYQPPKQRVDEDLAASEKFAGTSLNNQPLIPQPGVHSHRTLSLHHGTKSEHPVDSFDLKHQRSGFYPGVYMTTDPQRAAEHGRPMLVDFKGHIFNIKSPEHADALHRHFGGGGSGHKVVEGLKAAGYHGISRGDEHIIFDPKHAVIRKSEDLDASEVILDSLEKGAIKNMATAAVMAGALLGSPQEAQGAGKVPHADSYSSHKMLRTIADVESTGGKFTNHKALSGPIHEGERAIGKYALTPATIRDTIKMHSDLKHKYSKASRLKGDDMVRFIQDNPALEQRVAEKHLSRLEHHFGKDPSMISYGWLNGVSGTYRALKEKRDIQNNWHVLKTIKSYGGQK